MQNKQILKTSKFDGIEEVVSWEEAFDKVRSYYTVDEQGFEEMLESGLPINTPFSYFEPLGERRVVTVYKTTYGSNKYEVISVDYHNGGEEPTFELFELRRDPAYLADLLHLIELAQAHGSFVEFKDFNPVKLFGDDFS